MRPKNLIRSVVVAAVVLVATTMIVGQTKSRAWISGTWEGTGYQIDDKSTWTMQLTARGRRFSIDYPSLNCGGRWRLISINATRARFREILDHGQDKCTDKGNVVIQRVRSNQVMFLYSNAGTREVTASAILNRKAIPKTP
jgi:hypothetical protein